MIAPNYLNQIKIAQINCRKSQHATRTALKLTEFDILLIQEPYTREAANKPDKKEPPPTKDWIPALSEGSTGRVRAVTYINSRSDIRLHYSLDNTLTNNDLVVIKIRDLTIANLYNQPNNCDVSEKGALAHFQTTTDGTSFQKTIIAGDFNLHHPRWEPDKRPNKAARDAVQWMEENEFELCSEPGEPTHISGSVIDLVIATTDIAETVIVHDLEEERHDTTSDHLLIPWTIYLNTNLKINLNKQQTRFNMNKINLECFQQELIDRCENLNPSEVKTDEDIDELAEALEKAAAKAMDSSMPKYRKGRHPRKYFNQELADLKRTAHIKRGYMSILKDEESKQEWLEASNKLCERALEVNRQGWSDYLTNLKGHEIWRAMKVVKNREGATVTPELRTGPESWTKCVEERCQILRTNLLPKTKQGKCRTPKARVEAKWPPLTYREVEEVIRTLPRKKAPGPDLVTGEILQAMWEVQAFKDTFFALLEVCVRFGYHPKTWRIGTVVVLRKPNKKSYDDPKSYRPITLLKVPSKVLEKIIQRRLSHLTLNKLPDRQFGARAGYCATDAVLELVDYIKEDLSATTTAMMVDIKGAFDNVNRKKLIKVMRKLGLPETAVKWVFEFTKYRSASLVLDGFETEADTVSTGVPQGSPISPLLFLIYTTPLYDMVEAEGLQVTGFVDDITIYTRGSMEENTERLSKALRMVCEWAKSMHTEIDLGDKLGFVHFNRSRKFPDIKDISLALPGKEEKKKPDEEVKLLGVVLDRRLDFGAHVRGTIKKTERALRAISVLGGTVRGVSGSALRSMYLACVRTVMEYGCEIWLNGDVGQIKRLESIQYNALKRVAGAYKGTVSEILEKEVAVPPLRLRLEFALESKLSRILFRVDHKNPVFEGLKKRKKFGKNQKSKKREKEKNQRKTKNQKNQECQDNQKNQENQENQKKDKNEKNQKKSKRQNFDDTRNNYLANIPQNGDLANLPVLEEPPPWDERTPDQDDAAAAAEYWKALRARRHEDLTNLLHKWNERYQTFLASRAGKWYKEITKNNSTSPTTNINKLVTAKTLKNDPRRIFSRITQLRTGNGDIGEYLQKRKVPKDHYNCICGEFETVKHIIRHCPRTEHKRFILSEVSPDLDMSKLLDTQEGLQAIKEFLLRE